MNITRSCAHCGQPLSGKANQVYCSGPCRKAAFKQKAPLAPPPDAPAPVVSPAGPARQVLPPPGARGATDAKDAKQALRLQQKEHQHLERLKQMDHAEAERERTHQLGRLEQRRIEEQRELIDLILDLHRQHRQLTGQSTADLPLAATVRTVADARALAHLPMPAPVAPLPTLPMAIIEEAKTLFKEFTKKRSSEWAQSELTPALTSLTKLLNQVRQWQSAHPTLALSEQSVYRLGEALRSVVAARLSTMAARFLVWDDPTIELQMPPKLMGELKRFIQP